MQLNPIVSGSGPISQKYSEREKQIDQKRITSQAIRVLTIVNELTIMSN